MVPGLCDEAKIVFFLNNFQMLIKGAQIKDLDSPIYDMMTNTGLEKYLRAPSYNNIFFLKMIILKPLWLHKLERSHINAVCVVLLFQKTVNLKYI